MMGSLSPPLYDPYASIRRGNKIFTIDPWESAERDPEDRPRLPIGSGLLGIIGAARALGLGGSLLPRWLAPKMPAPAGALPGIENPANNQRVTNQIGEIKRSVERTAQNNSAIGNWAAELNGLPNSGLTLGQRTMFPSPVGGKDDLDLPPVLNGARANSSDAPIKIAVGGLPAWLNAATNPAGAGALGIPSLQANSPSSAGKLTSPTNIDVPGSSLDPALSRRVSTWADQRYYQDKSNTEDSGEEKKNQVSRKEDEPDDELDDNDFSKLPRRRAPKLPPGPRPGNPGGNSSRPKRFEDCSRAAQGETADWTAFCKTVSNRKNNRNKVAGGETARYACRQQTQKSPESKMGWCANQYGPDSRKNQGPTLSSSAFNPLQKPPFPKRTRPFKADYPHLKNNESGAKLKFDIDGHPLDANYIAGRRTVGGPDESLSDKDAAWLTHFFEDHATEFLRRSWANPPDDLRLAKIDRNGRNQKRFIKYRVLARMLDDMTRIPWDSNLEEELRQIYNDLNGKVGRGKVVPRGQQTTPEDFGIKGGDSVYREYFREAFRAAIQDENYLKTVAPKVTARLRKALRDNQLTRKWIRINSIEPGVSADLPA
jgi:hypothetical protein